MYVDVRYQERGAESIIHLALKSEVTSKQQISCTTR